MFASTILTSDAMTKDDIHHSRGAAVQQITVSIFAHCRSLLIHFRIVQV